MNPPQLKVQRFRGRPNKTTGVRPYCFRFRQIGNNKIIIPSQGYSRAIDRQSTIDLIIQHASTAIVLDSAK